MNPIITDVQDFHVNFIRAKPGRGAASHTHPTVEVFIPMSGRWAVYWGDDDEEKVLLEQWDVISVPPGVLRVYLSAYVRWVEPTNPDDAGSMLRLPATVVIDTGIDQVRLDQAAVGALTTALQRLGNAPQPNQNGSTPVPYDNLINCCDLAGRRGTIVVLADHGRVLMITATGETTVLGLPQTGQLRAALRDAALDAARHPVDTS